MQLAALRMAWQLIRCEVRHKRPEWSQFLAETGIAWQINSKQLFLLFPLHSLLHAHSAFPILLCLNFLSFSSFLSASSPPHSFTRCLFFLSHFLWPLPTSTPLYFLFYCSSSIPGLFFITLLFLPSSLSSLLFHFFPLPHCFSLSTLRHKQKYTVFTM